MTERDRAFIRDLVALREECEHPTGDVGALLARVATKLNEIGAVLAVADDPQVFEDAYVIVRYMFAEALPEELDRAVERIRALDRTPNA